MKIKRRMNYEKTLCLSGNSLTAQNNALQSGLIGVIILIYSNSLEKDAYAGTQKSDSSLSDNY